MFDSSVHCGQSEAGPLADALGREEWFEDVGQRVFVHAAAIITYGEARILSSHKPRMTGRVFLIEGVISGLNDNISTSKYGVARIDA